MKIGGKDIRIFYFSYGAVNNMIKYAREQFFINANDMLDKNGKSNPKSYWKLVKKLMGNFLSPRKLRVTIELKYC
jgi:hypothetical protein